jgi:hypothetical protein
MKFIKFIIFNSFLFLFSNFHSQQVCCEKPEDVWLTLVECSQKSNYDKVKSLISPNGLASRDVYMICNPGKEVGPQILSKKQFAQIYIDYKNSGFPKTKTEFL